MNAKDLEAWFATWQGPLGYEVRDLKIGAGEDVAFCHSLNRLSGTKTDGEKRMSGFAKHSASARFGVTGGSRISTNRCRSTWTAATGRRSTSNPSV